MKVELRCPSCRYRFPAYLEAAALERLQEEGPWHALGDGETLEDRICSDLTEQAETGCPHCGSAVTVAEESLSALSRNVLAMW